MKTRLTLTRLLVLPVAILALATHHLHGEGSLTDVLLGSAGLALLIAAAGGRAWASAYVAGRKNTTLVTDGPYSLVRNPLYLFSLLGFVGAGLAFESLTLAAVLGLAFFLSHWPAIRREETELARLFGSDYERYRRGVPRFIPKLRHLRIGNTIPLDPQRFALALRDCMAIPLIVIVAEAVEWAKLNDVLPVLFLIP